MATKYIDPGGNNGDTGAIGDPWETFSGAVANATDGDDIIVNDGTYNNEAGTFVDFDQAKDLTFTAAEGASPILEETHVFYTLYFRLAQTYSFTGISFTGLGLRLITIADVDATIIFTDCTFTSVSDSTSLFRCVTTSRGQDVAFINCTFNHAHGHLYGMFYLDGFGKLTIDGCTINSSGGPRVFYMKGDWSTGLYILNSNWTVDDEKICDFSQFGIAENMPEFKFNDNTVTGGTTTIYNPERDISFMEIAGNVIVTSAGILSPIHLGNNEYEVSPDHYITGVYIHDNVITNTGGHVVLLGTNCWGAEVCDNTFIQLGNDYCLVLKGQYLNVHHNMIVSGTTVVYFNGARYCNFQYNTCITKGEIVITWDKAGYAGNGTYYYGSQNYIKNNYIDGGDGSYAVVEGISAADGSDAGHWHMIFDYNYYVAGSVDLIRLNGINYASIEDVRTKWATYSEMFPLNDANSRAGSDLLIDKANGDYRLKATAEDCLNQGKPTLQTGYTSIGCWQRKSFLGVR